MPSVFASSYHNAPIVQCHQVCSHMAPIGTYTIDQVHNVVFGVYYNWQVNGMINQFIRTPLRLLLLLIILYCFLFLCFTSNPYLHSKTLPLSSYIYPLPLTLLVKVRSLYRDPYTFLFSPYSLPLALPNFYPGKDKVSDLLGINQMNDH